MGSLSSSTVTFTCQPAKIYNIFLLRCFLSPKNCCVIQIYFWVILWNIVYLGHILIVFLSCPHKYQEIGHKECAHEADNHRILSKSPKQLGSAWGVDKIGSDKERAPKEGEVVAEALGDWMCGPNTNLGRQQHLLSLKFGQHVTHDRITEYLPCIRNCSNPILTHPKMYMQ